MRFIVAEIYFISNGFNSSTPAATLFRFYLMCCSTSLTIAGANMIQENNEFLTGKQLGSAFDTYFVDLTLRDFATESLSTI